VQAPGQITLTPTLSHAEKTRGRRAGRGCKHETESYKRGAADRPHPNPPTRRRRAGEGGIFASKVGLREKPAPSRPRVFRGRTEVSSALSKEGARFVPDLLIRKAPPNREAPQECTITPVNWENMAQNLEEPTMSTCTRHLSTVYPSNHPACVTDLSIHNTPGASFCAGPCRVTQLLRNACEESPARLRLDVDQHARIESTGGVERGICGA
jgi:hypothetical protein